jgi:hypothetical protein
MRTGGYTLPISQSDRSQRTFLNNDMPLQEHGWGWVEVRLKLSASSALDGDRWSVSCASHHFTPPGRDLVPNVQDTGWAPRPVWMGMENLAPHWDLIL